MLSERKSPRIFYGWWVVVASLFIALFVGGVVFYGFTAIFEPISKEQNWSYTQVSLAASIRSVEAGLLAPLTGWLVDRLGPRRVIFIGGIIVALGLFLVSRTTSLAMFYGGFVLIATGMDCCSMTVLVTAVTNWFRRNLGIASGIAVAGFGFGGLVIPVMVKLIDAFTWRGALAILSVSVLVTVVPLSLLFRHKPEQYGLYPDGDQAPVLAAVNQGQDAVLKQEVDFKPRQAMKTRTFWLLALAFTCQTLVVNAVVTHVMPYLSSIGIDRALASIIATLIPITSILGRLSLGWLGDKIKRKWVVIGSFGISAIGLLAFATISMVGVWLFIPFLLLFGVGYGGINALRPPYTREFFGKGSFGTIFGTLIGVSSVGGIVGPYLGGMAYDTWHSYLGLWFVMALLPIIAMITTMSISSRRLGVEPSAKT
jgi:MFS family permease